MRWVKVTIITLIVLAIIPTIIMTINKISGGDTKRVEYEIIITKNNVNEMVYELYDLVKLDGNNNVTNLLYVEYKGEILNVTKFYYSERYNELEINYPSDGETRFIRFNLDDPVNKSVFSDDVKIVLYDEIVVEPSLSPSEIILISLIPLILISGLLIYQYKELGLKIRKE